MIIPKHLQIEIVAGFCPSRCVMCPIENSPRKQIMSDAVFKVVLERFSPYRDYLEYTTLHGLGEPLLDKNIVKKIKMAKNMGFPSVGFATVAVNLSEDLAVALIDAGLDTIIFSVDGIKKETHEAIRKGTDFNKVLLNIDNFIRLRNNQGHTKIIVRMIRQDLNRTEWDDYRKFWMSRQSSDFGDQVSVFDVHNWGGDSGLQIENRLKEISAHTPIVCADLYERFFVYVNGQVGLCCGDEMGWFQLGNVIEEDPVQIYNRGEFVK